MAGEVAFEGWAIVELMGHRTRGGYAKDVELFGGKMLRIDIPVATDTTVTEFYGCSAIYALRPCTEQIVKDHVKRSHEGDMRPIRPVDYRPNGDEPKLLDRGGDDFLEDDQHF